MNWGDLDYDGDLDLVTGSYDAELSLVMSNQVLFNGGTGIHYYQNQDGSFVETQLTEQAQALTILLSDINSDAKWDIIAGNDFSELDRHWTSQESGWEEITPFTTITHSTMSFDSADLHNDGSQELCATDMHLYSVDETTMAAWQPVMDDMMAMPMMEGDPQAMSNMLQTMVDGAYLNTAEAMGINASAGVGHRNLATWIAMALSISTLSMA